MDHTGLLPYGWNVKDEREFSIHPSTQTAKSTVEFSRTVSLVSVVGTGRNLSSLVFEELVKVSFRFDEFDVLP